jgi:hypothetical protein
MTRFDDLDRALTAYFDIEAAAPAPAGLLESAMTSTSRRRPRPAALARLRAGRTPTVGGETARTLLIAAALAALLLLVVGFALIGGGRDRSPLLGDAVTSTPPSAEPSSQPVFSGPADDSLRATWIALAPALPLLGTGSGPVSMTISQNGTSLTAANFGPDATFDSTVSQLDNGTMKLVLDHASGGCQQGAIGTYRLMPTADGSLLGLVPIDDDCATRAEALGRTWGRSLAASTSLGSGYVATMSTPFFVKLPDQDLSARSLQDMIEIGGPGGFSLMAFRNPQGFVDACSDKEQRVPYVPGAKAFADFLQHNRVLTTVSRDELTIDGNHAIHIVTLDKPDPCPQVPQDGLYLWTPKDCVCHFVGGHDSLYLVDLPNGDTMMFEVSPVDENSTVERDVIGSLRIPVQPPGS